MKVIYKDGKILKTEGTLLERAKFWKGVWLYKLFELFNILMYAHDEKNKKRRGL